MRSHSLAHSAAAGQVQAPKNCVAAQRASRSGVVAVPVERGIDPWHVREWHVVALFGGDGADEHGGRCVM
jgi:hypothetical protein